MDASQSGINQSCLKLSATPTEQEGHVGLCLWAESPEEARNFLARAAQSGFNGRFDAIFVAKRSSKSRGNNYTGGEYFRTTNDENVDVYNDVIFAPSKITELVQWCTCDIMVSRQGKPVFVLEDTTHIVRMNLYQRFPRLALAARLGVPSVVLQGTVGLNFRLRGDRWALYRYLHAFHALSCKHPDAPCIPFWYLHTQADERRAQDEAFIYLNALLGNDKSKISSIRKMALDGIGLVMREGVKVKLGDKTGDVARDVPCIKYDGDEVIVKVGAKPHKKSWKCKGSGQMDPYLGLILAAKYMHCFDDAGKQVKQLVVEFTYLPKDFWFFNRPETTSLYKTLAKEFADDQRFLGKAYLEV